VDGRGSGVRPGPEDARIRNQSESEAPIGGRLRQRHAGQGNKNSSGNERDLSPVELAQAPQGTKQWPYSVRIISSPASPLQVFGSMFGTVLQVLGSIGVVIILVVFFLIRREDLRDRFILLVGQDQVSLTTRMLEDAGTRVSRYLATEFLVNVIFGTAVGVGLYLIGVPNPILWGILATILRFIPYLGPWLAAAMPIGLSMAISGDWVAPGLTIVLFVVLELFTSNVLEPWLYGKNTGVSAVAVLLAAVFLDLVVGSGGAAAGDPADRVSAGGRQARSPAFLLEHTAGRQAGVRAHEASLSAAPGWR
jgi:predicted PurR-regulated permease PerM